MSEKKEFSVVNADVKIDDAPMAAEIVDNEEEGLLIKFNKPFKFEGKEYTEIDLSGLEDMSAADMIAVNKLMARTSGVDVMPEVSLEYAVNLAARAAKQPIEFFTALPMKEAMKVKNRVMGFLFGSD